MTAREPAAPKKIAGNAACVVCSSPFIYEAPPGADPPATCGMLHCRARNDWTAEDWEGAARMAEARKASGFEIETTLDDNGEPVARRVPVWLTPIDREALRRAERSTPGAAA